MPIRLDDFSELEMEDLAEYLHMLNAAGCEVLVVDGSPPAIFEVHECHWGELCRHVPVDPRYRSLNEMAGGISTGIDLASCEFIIVGDGDICYTWHDIERMCVLLERHEMVRPQNYCSPLPWWARVDAAGMLVGRAFSPAGDRTGTCGFRRETIRRVQQAGDDEPSGIEAIVRHAAAQGVEVWDAGSFFVRKNPPTLAGWLEDRSRAAFGEGSGGWRTGISLAFLPACMALWLLFGWEAALSFAVIAATVMIVLATLGRRGGAQKHFPPVIPFWAPIWGLVHGISLSVAFCRGLFQRGPGGRRLGNGDRRGWNPSGGALPLQAAEQSSGDVGS